MRYQKKSTLLTIALHSAKDIILDIRPMRSSHILIEHNNVNMRRDPVENNRLLVCQRLISQKIGKEKLYIRSLNLNL